MLIYTVIFIVIFLVVIIQSTLIPLIDIKGVVPDLVLIFIVYWSCPKGRRQGVVWGFLGGILQDLALGTTAGIFALSKSLACYLAFSFPWNCQRSDTLLMSIMLFVAAFLHQIVYFIFTSVKAEAGFLALFLRYGFPSVLYTLFLGFFIYSFVGWWEKRKKTEKVG